MIYSCCSSVCIHSGSQIDPILVNIAPNTLESLVDNLIYCCPFGLKNNGRQVQSLSIQYWHFQNFEIHRF